MSRELPDVRPGQVWADNDKRSRGRTVKVLEVVDRGGDPHAIVQVLTVARGALPLDPRKPRITRIAVRRFVPNSTGYRLEKDA